MMDFPELKPVKSSEALRKRVNSFFCEIQTRSPRRTTTEARFGQLSFQGMHSDDMEPQDSGYVDSNVVSFLDLLTDSLPEGDVYLFGGIIRDLAVFGRKGFSSDIDLVVDGDWDQVLPYLESYNAIRNKFGGYRFYLGRWPIDIWHAKNTWAIKQGYVEYKGISSLSSTTVLNWDGILMNWRTKYFIHQSSYFDDITSRSLDVVLQQNPNPLGMAIRVFRHLRQKDARKITARAVKYLSNIANEYSFEQMKSAEIASYGNSLLQEKIYSFFQSINGEMATDIEHQFSILQDIYMKELEFNGKKT